MHAARKVRHDERRQAARGEPVRIDRDEPRSGDVVALERLQDARLVADERRVPLRRRPLRAAVLEPPEDDDRTGARHVLDGEGVCQRGNAADGGAGPGRPSRLCRGGTRPSEACPARLAATLRPLAATRDAEDRDRVRHGGEARVPDAAEVLAVHLQGHRRARADRARADVLDVG